MPETIDGPYELVERSFFLHLIDAIKFAQLASDEDIERRNEGSFCRSSIISSIVLIESLSNILIERMPWRTLKKDLDRLPILSKIDVYLLYLGKEPLDRGRRELQPIEELKRIRDSFVHPRMRTRQGDREHSEDGLSFNFPFGSYATTAISHSPSLWSSKDATSAAFSAVAFVRYLLIDVLDLSIHEIFKLITSEVRLGDFAGAISETELKNTIQSAHSLGIDIAFFDT